MQTTNRKIRVLVVDDSAVARSVIIQGLSASPRIEVVGYAVNAMDAKTKLQHLSPDVMTLDVEMPGINGIDFLKQFLPSHPLPSSSSPPLTCGSLMRWPRERWTLCASLTR